jgi:predicted transcriptional regulator
MSELEKWFIKILTEKNEQGIRCEISSYLKGNQKKYMFLVEGELRNIERYLQPEELIQYRLLISKKPVKRAAPSCQDL